MYSPLSKKKDIHGYLQTNRSSISLFIIVINIIFVLSSPRQD